jgi:hypothetical protein
MQLISVSALAHFSSARGRRNHVRMFGCVGLLLSVFAPVSQAFAQTNTFSLQADPQSINVTIGHSNTVTISTSVVSGEAETISFDASGMPPGVTPMFAPTSLEAGSSTTLTLAADNIVIAGTTATITIHGQSPSDSETTTVSLRVGIFLSADEWTALSALYDATGGSTWTTNTGWDFSLGVPNGTECGWYGITCDKTPRVIAITLPNNNLTGTMSDLSAFSALDTLNLLGNNLSGPLPASIQDLSSLTTIVVSGNQFSGSLDALNGLADLQQFEGDDNAFTGTLPQFSSMPNLMGFSAQGNQLTGSIPSLALSSKLVFLDVSGNYIGGSVPSLNALVNLHYLYISGNRLTGVMPNPPTPNQLHVAFLCPNFFAPIDNSQWDFLLRTNPWYSGCDTNTIFAAGFGEPPVLQ